MLSGTKIGTHIHVCLKRLVVLIHLRHLPETLSYTNINMFCLRGWNAWKKTKCVTRDKMGTKAVVQAHACLRKSSSGVQIFKACTDPTLYIPFPLIVGVPEKRRYFLRSAWKCLETFLAKDRQDTHEDSRFGTSVSEKVLQACFQTCALKATKRLNHRYFFRRRRRAG